MLFLRLFFITLFVVSGAQAMGVAPGPLSKLVDENGSITFPKDFYQHKSYRHQWSHLGSWLIDDPQAPGHGFHDVYVQPGVAEHYRKTNEFPDGAVIIKEVRSIQQGQKTTGQARWAGEVTIWFVMIKDTQGRYRGSAHWSNGWGWALFENKKPVGNEAGNESAKQNLSKGFAASCQGCHTPAKNKDWVFIEGYPTLIEK